MSLTKPTLFAAAAAIAITAFAATLTSNAAHAGVNNERLNECAWYKSRAMANGRAGDRAQAEHYWFLYRECMNYRID